MFIVVDFECCFERLREGLLEGMNEWMFVFELGFGFRLRCFGWVELLKGLLEVRESRLVMNGLFGKLV
ncbi:hypothetical protein, partial [Paenibacillus xylanexedens]|uniref:hypothetical protein n=1 Tax=Paenibacillus xylanexedens TaxID=528191 RepID=UPI001C92E904